LARESRTFDHRYGDDLPADPLSATMYTDLKDPFAVTDLDSDLLATLQSYDTPTICNALELLVPQRRGWGFTVTPLVCVRPGLPPLVAVARTARIRAMHPADVTGIAARELSDAYYRYIAEGRRPSVVVMQDLDAPNAGYGSFWGEVNSHVHRGLQCMGVITDGSVRDLPALADGFQVLADRIGPSHAFVHVVDFGKPVTVAGMRVRDGDLIHADQHGAVVIPWDVANGVRAAADTIARRERVIIDASKRPDFDITRLLKAFGDAADIH
jgi:regulator of RNase E activity RraA